MIYDKFSKPMAAKNEVLLLLLYHIPHQIFHITLACQYASFSAIPYPTLNLSYLTLGRNKMILEFPLHHLLILRWAIKDDNYPFIRCIQYHVW